MTAAGVPSNAKLLAALLKKGEGPALEFKRSTGELKEGMEFLRKTMPLGARFPSGEIFREDRFPVPLEALREILLNAVMHRDYSHYSGYVTIAVFDDRIEIVVGCVAWQFGEGANLFQKLTNAWSWLVMGFA